MNNNNSKIEIMSPAGSYESLHAAIQGGAGSVYFGAGKLNMRSRSSKNFTIADLKNIASICDENVVRSYLALNTVIYDHEMGDMAEMIDAAKESGISAIIATDQAVINYCREVGMEVHISTQLNVSNTEAVKFYSQFADVMVLARELNLDQWRVIAENIKSMNITGPSGKPVQLEVFVHGALCMSISGKCYLSLHEKNYSANRGACLQTCRRSYTVQDTTSDTELEIDNEYIMSPKDLCTISFLDRILDAGITVLKIEGRGRSPEYVKTVTECYHEAVEAYFDNSFSEEKVKAWEERLGTVFNRGFWDGYYLGRRTGEWTDSYGNLATQTKEYIAKTLHFYKKISVGVFRIQTGELNIGDKILITGPTSGVVETEIKELRIDEQVVEKAVKGDVVSIHLPSTVRQSDKLFKIISRNINE